MFDLQPDHLAGAQPAAIAETEQKASLEAAGDGQQALRLIRTHHQRNLLRLAEVIDLGRKVQSPQCHAEQEPQPGHDAVAVADARARLGQVQLEAADVLKCGRVWRALEKRSEPLAAADVAPLRARAQLARIHVFDQALAKRTDSIGGHGRLLSGMRWITPRSSRQGATPATDDLSLETVLAVTPPASAGYRAAISALAPSDGREMSALAPLLGAERTSSQPTEMTRLTRSEPLL